MSIHNHENYSKNHSLKFFTFSQMTFWEVPLLNSRDLFTVSNREITTFDFHCLQIGLTTDKISCILFYIDVN